jgi:hypothetical protein
MTDTHPTPGANIAPTDRPFARSSEEDLTQLVGDALAELRARARLQEMRRGT